MLYYVGGRVDGIGLGNLYRIDIENPVVKEILNVIGANDVYIYYLKDDGYIYKYDLVGGSNARIARFENEYVDVVNTADSNKCVFSLGEHMYSLNLYDYAISELFDHESHTLLSDDKIVLLNITGHNTKAFSVYKNSDKQIAAFTVEGGDIDCGRFVFYDNTLYLINDSYGDTYMHIIRNSQFSKELLLKDSLKNRIIASGFHNGTWYFYIIGSPYPRIVSYNLANENMKIIKKAKEIEDETCVSIDIQYNKIWFYKYLPESTVTFLYSIDIK